MAYNIGAKIQLEGEKEYRQQIKSIGLSQAELTSQMKKLTAEFNDNADSVEYLTQKSELLNQQNDKHQEKIEKIAQRLEKTTEQYEKNAKAVDEYRTEIQNAEKALEEMTASGNASEEAIREQEAALLELEKALSAAERNGQKLSDSMTQLRTQLNEAETAALGTKREIKEVSEQLERGEEDGDGFGSSIKGSFDEAGISVEGFGGKLLDVADKFTEAKESGLNATDAMKAAITGALIPAIGEMISQLLEAKKQYEELQVEAETRANNARFALGLTQEEAQKFSESIDRVFMRGTAESKDDVSDALTNVYRVLGETGTQAEDTTANLITLKNVFGTDYSETVKTASTLMKTFGIDSEEALNLIYNGLQSSANKSGDLLDVLNEYSNSFDRMGYSADEFMASLIEAADTGAYSVDKAADAVKEFYNQAVDASDDFKDALSQLGLDADGVTEAILEGGDKSRKALEQTVKKIEGLQDQTQKAKVSAALFGSQWEDVGTDAVLAISKSSEKAKEFTDDLDEATRQLTVSSEANLRALQNTAEEVGLKVASTFFDLVLPPVADLWEMVKKLNSSLREAQYAQASLTGGSTVLTGLVPMYSGYATGVASAAPGVHAVAENGPELVTSPTYRAFSGGERVYNAQQTSTLLGGSMDTDRIVSAIQSLERKLEIQQTNVNQFTIDLRSAKDINTLLQYFENEQRRGRAR